mmetsp:Transcript_119817/g.310814  ORF Transcript_119817/g.310814 Transcript_119817/m.310814 type:complete len:229 (+) Transcript_119817:547-1233(+)
MCVGRQAGLFLFLFLLHSYEGRGMSPSTSWIPALVDGFLGSHNSRSSGLVFRQHKSNYRLALGLQELYNVQVGDRRAGSLQVRTVRRLLLCLSCRCRRCRRWLAIVVVTAAKQPGKCRLFCLLEGPLLGGEELSNGCGGSVSGWSRHRCAFGIALLLLLARPGHFGGGQGTVAPFALTLLNCCRLRLICKPLCASACHLILRAVAVLCLTDPCPVSRCHDRRHQPAPP